MIFVSGWGDRSETDIRMLPVGRRQTRLNRYSVFCVLDSADRVLDRGRIVHGILELFVELVGRHSNALAVFETTMGMGSTPTGRSGGAKLAAERIARSL
jgi:hypothetical protein